jgi:Protein of unknown function C-terminus (DUF2399)
MASRRRFRDGAAVQDRPGAVRCVPSGTRNHKEPFGRRRYVLAALAGLAGEPAGTPWDPELAATMRYRNLRIEEELTLDALLEDLTP